MGSNREALDLLVEAVELAGFKVGEEVVFALDVAASELYTDGKYQLHSENLTLTSQELVAYYAELVKNYPIVSIEDGLDEAGLGRLEAYNRAARWRTCSWWEMTCLSRTHVF